MEHRDSMEHGGSMEHRDSMEHRARSERSRTGRKMMSLVPFASESCKKYTKMGIPENQALPKYPSPARVSSWGVYESVRKCTVLARNVQGSKFRVQGKEPGMFKVQSSRFRVQKKGILTLNVEHRTLNVFKENVR
jgi:hypothetical protein